MTNTPAYLKDAKDLLTKAGFATSNTWYHGTSSLLLEPITQDGLKRSGDTELKAAAKQTMKTIGNQYQESVEPVFLTQSKELAYYWAEQTVRERKLRFSGQDQPIVLSVQLPDELNSKVKPDVGAASLLLLHEGERYMVYLASIYQTQQLGIPEIDLMKANRMEYLTTLGMAYYDDDIDPSCISLVSE